MPISGSDPPAAVRPPHAHPCLKSIPHPHPHQPLLVLPPFYLRSTSVKPASYLRKACGRRTEVERRWNGGGTEVERRYYRGSSVYGWRACGRILVSHGMCLECAPAYCAEEGLSEADTARVLAAGHGATSRRKRNPAVRRSSCRLEPRRGGTIIAQGKRRSRQRCPHWRTQPPARHNCGPHGGQECGYFTSNTFVVSSPN